MANNIETYCMVQIRKRYRSEFDIDKVNIKDFSDRTPYGTISYYIWIDYGDRKGWNWLKMKNGKFYKFDSFVEAINFMAKQGWKLIKIFWGKDSKYNEMCDILFSKEIST